MFNWSPISRLESLIQIVSFFEASHFANVRTDDSMLSVFGVYFQRIAATATYSTAPNIPFGGGSLTAVDIFKNSNTTIHFPFTINYTTTIDPSLSILKDISNRCGFTGNPKVIRPLVVDYTIRLTLKLVSVSISPS